MALARYEPATCPFALGARSLAEFGPYLTAPATCPCFGREVSGGVWPLIDFSGDLPLRWARGIWRSLALTLRWAESLPLLRRARDSAICPYFAQCRVLATFALGTVSIAGRPLLSGAATGHASTARPAHLWPGAVSGTGLSCAGHMISVFLALTLCCAELLPLLRRARALVWPLLCAGPRPGHFCAGPGSLCFALTLRRA